jgi:hypothetical protein
LSDFGLGLSTYLAVYKLGLSTVIAEYLSDCGLCLFTEQAIFLLKYPLFIVLIDYIFV